MPRGSKPWKCQPCGSTKNVHHHIGQPFSLVCEKCHGIIVRWEEAKKAQHDIWRQVNGVDPPVCDEDEIGRRVMEVEVLCAEIRRVLHNQMREKQEEKRRR